MTKPKHATGSGSPCIQNVTEPQVDVRLRSGRTVQQIRSSSCVGLSSRKRYSMGQGIEWQRWVVVCRMRPTPEEIVALGRLTLAGQEPTVDTDG